MPSVTKIAGSRLGKTGSKRSPNTSRLKAVGGERTANVRSIRGYAERMVPAERIPLSPRERATEAIFLGLRRLEGIDVDAFSSRYGVDVLAEYREGLAPLFQAGLVEISGSHLRLTPPGLVLSNEVFAAFV